MSEIIYVCDSINNKNVRDGELNILKKFENELYFEFGENETNIKKRIYRDLETLNKDYNALLKIKENQNKKEEPVKEERKLLNNSVNINNSVNVKNSETKKLVSEKSNTTRNNLRNNTRNNMKNKEKKGLF